MNTKILSVLVAVASLSFAAVKNNDVMLNLDYSSRPDWLFSIQYHSQCVFVQNNAATDKKTDLTCRLKGLLNDKKDRLRFSVLNLNLTSDLYSEQVRKQMVDALSKAEPTLKLLKGCPTVDTAADLSSGGIPEWNLYVQFAKLLPEMPEQAVKKGFTWERQATVPLKMEQGTVHCEMYRAYKIDSLSSAKNLAYLSWQFKYSAVEGLADSASLLKHLPVSGSGSGAAVIDIAGKYIVKASMKFETPVAIIDKVKVNWIEKAAMEYTGTK